MNIDEHTTARITANRKALLAVNEIEDAMRVVRAKVVSGTIEGDDLRHTAEELVKLTAQAERLAVLREFEPGWSG